MFWQRGWTYSKNVSFSHITSRKSDVSNDYSCNHKWKVCECSSNLPSGTGVSLVWLKHYTSEYGKLDDTYIKHIW